MLKSHLILIPHYDRSTAFILTFALIILTICGDAEEHIYVIANAANEQHTTCTCGIYHTFHFKLARRYERYH